MGNHNAIINAKTLISRKHTPSPIPSHQPHHLLQPLIAAHPSHDQHLATPHMRHRPLRNFHQHRIDRLLETKAQIRRRNNVPRSLIPHIRIRLQIRGQDINARQDPRKRAIHPLHRIRQVHQHTPLLRQLLNVIPRRGIIADLQRAREPVQTVAHGDIERLPEDPVPLLRIRDDLRVPAAHVQHDRVLGAGDLAAHLDVADAVVDADEGLVPEEGEHARGDGDGLEGRTHAGTFGVADAVDV